MDVQETIKNQIGRKYTALSEFEKRMGLSKYDLLSLTDEEFAVFLQEKRKKLLQAHAPNEVQKVFNKEVRPIKKYRQLLKDQNRKEIRKKSCVIMDAAYPQRNSPENWVPLYQRKFQFSPIGLDKVSIMDRPVEAFELLAQIARQEASFKKLEINYRGGACVDISPILIFKLMYDNFPKPSNPFIGGVITDEFGDIFKKLGLLGALRINLNKSANDDGNPSYANFAFPLRSWSPPKIDETISLEQKEKLIAESDSVVGDTGANFAKQLVSWVETHGKSESLINNLEIRIRDAVSELIDNAKRHGMGEGVDCEWHICGLLQKRQFKEKIITFCNIVVLNRGISFYQSLKNADEKVSKRISDYVLMHNKEVDEEVLWNICALQDDVSCKHDNPNGSLSPKGRGMATAMMNVLNDAFDYEDVSFSPSFTFVSGKSWIKAATPYNKIMEDSAGVRTIAFNNENDLNVKPDINHVGLLPWSFPGTVITFRFVINVEEALTKNSAESYNG